MADDPRIVGANHTDGDSECVCGAARAETVRQIMARGYAQVLVVLAIGFVAFVLMTSFMAFMHPERAQQFLSMYAGPAAALIAAYAAKVAHTYMTQIDKSKDTD